MPALANSRDGSLTGTTGEDGKGVCPRFDSKYSMNVCLTCKIGCVVDCCCWLLAAAAAVVVVDAAVVGIWAGELLLFSVFDVVAVGSVVVVCCCRFRGGGRLLFRHYLFVVGSVGRDVRRSLLVAANVVGRY